MTALDVRSLSDSLHRLAKLALDSGEAASLEDAIALFQTYSIHVAVTPEAVTNAAYQAAILTLVNAGRRAFLGGVTVSGVGGETLQIPSEFGSLRKAVIGLGGSLMAGPTAGVPEILLGNAIASRGAVFSLRVVLDGWSAAVVPGTESVKGGKEPFVLAGIAGAALALSEAFQFVRGSNPAAGRREVGLSLWHPGVSWRLPEAAGRAPQLLPASAWIIGLGNLGQAYLWALGMLPYADPAAVRLVLQDFDIIGPSNDSTSLLTNLSLVGQYKTRAMAKWAERRGFTTTIVERRFDARSSVCQDEPGIALCGVDNALARSQLEEAGFTRIIEAGLGGGISDFLALRLHTFPGKRRARDLWKVLTSVDEGFLDRPAYRRLAAEGMDRCGLVQLSGRTVGAPFVGALAGALVISELVRLANGGPASGLVDLHLRAPAHIEVVPQDHQFACNPGTTEAIGSTAES
jgi:hypothetical protein